MTSSPATGPSTSGSPIGPLFNRVTKYVATSTPDSLEWVNSVGLSGDVPARIAELKQGGGPDLLTQGSSVLLHALLAHDLVDELRLMTFPVVLGHGKRWFDKAEAPASLSPSIRSIATFSSRRGDERLSARRRGPHRVGRRRGLPPQLGRARDPVDRLDIGTLGPWFVRARPAAVSSRMASRSSPSQRAICASSRHMPPIYSRTGYSLPDTAPCGSERVLRLG
jgi:dihydrofolate reductase